MGKLLEEKIDREFEEIVKASFTVMPEGSSMSEEEYLQRIEREVFKKGAKDEMREISRKGS